MSKINCTSPHHEDHNASMEVYDDGSYCFSCGWIDRNIIDKDVVKPEPENIQETIHRILCHPRKIIRGLELPYTDAGFWVLWPDNSFYKFRRWDDNPRYQGPRGHQPPLFTYECDRKVLILAEGELNAMSLRHSIGPIATISSPGSASSFSKAIEYSLQFPTVYAILDRDAAGVAAGISFKRELMKLGRRVELICVTRDYNDALQEEGPEGVKAQFKKDLALS